MAEFDPISGRRLPPPTPRPVFLAEVELWGGPRDGEVLKVYDVDAPFVSTFRHNAEAKPGEVVYRRRPVGLDEPTRVPVWFDFEPASSVVA